MKIISGSFEALKSEMKQHQDNVKKKIKELEKVRKAQKGLSVRELEKLQDLELLQRFYTPSKVLPVRVAGKTINFKAYQSFMKKISRFPLEINETDEGLRVHYKTGSQSRGYIDYFDLSSYFVDFKNLPVAVLDDGEEA